MHSCLLYTCGIVNKWLHMRNASYVYYSCTLYVIIASLTTSVNGNWKVARGVYYYLNIRRFVKSWCHPLWSIYDNTVQCWINFMWFLVRYTVIVISLRYCRCCSGLHCSMLMMSVDTYAHHALMKCSNTAEYNLLN